MRTEQTGRLRSFFEWNGNHMLRHAAGWLLGCAAFWLLMIPVQAEEYPVSAVSGSGTVTTETLNVRSGPGKEYDSIELVKSGEIVVITGQTDNGWYQIELDGRTGYVSDKYVELKGELTESGPAGDEDARTEEIGEPEEGWAFYQNPRFLKAAVIVAIILVVLIMLVTTLRGMRSDRDPEDEDDDDSEDEDFDGDLTEAEDSGEDEVYEEEEEAEDSGDEIEVISGRATDPRTVVIREEDYRLHIDPKYFENTTQIEQPDMVTGYLERKKLEEELEAASAEGRQKELEQAMRKLSELQDEIERLKKNR